MYVLNLCAIGTPTGATIPKELLAKRRVGAGDTVYVTEGPDGGFRLTPHNPEFASQIELAERRKANHDAWIYERLTLETGATTPEALIGEVIAYVGR